MKPTIKNGFLAFALLPVFVCILFCPHGHAQINLYENETVKLDASLLVVATNQQTWNTNFGAGLNKPSGGNIANVGWREGYALPKLTAEISPENMGVLYGGVGYVFSKTWGVSDPSGSSFGQPEAIDNEYAYGGWRSGNLFADLGEDVIDISWGRQEFEIGNGFLVADGNLDTGGKGAVYLGPRNSFERTGILRINTKPVRADFFYLTSDTDFSDTHQYGANLEYVDEKYGTLGAYFFKINHADLTSTRDGLLTYSFRGDGDPLAAFGVENTHFAFEAAFQDNDHAGRDVDAVGWYISGDYTFSEAAWSPNLMYRFSHFSGDDPNTTQTESFDPLYVAGPGYGTWFQGEITGQYLITNTNLNVHAATLSAEPPIEGLTLGVQYFHFTLDERGDPVTGGATTSDHFGDEVNLIAEYQATDWLYISPVYGVLIPGTAAQEINGDDEAFHLFEVIVSLEF